MGKNKNNATTGIAQVLSPNNSQLINVLKDDSEKLICGSQDENGSSWIMIENNTQSPTVTQGDSISENNGERLMNETTTIPDNRELSTIGCDKGETICER